MNRIAGGRIVMIGTKEGYGSRLSRGAKKRRRSYLCKVNERVDIETA